MLEARAFEPDFLSRLDNLVMGVRQARSVRAGQRRIGRILGSGLELENYKDYAEGDDLRFLDWNAYARLDDLMIRTYRAERQIELTALVDASASMGVPAGDDKLGLALALAGAAAYVAMGANDAARIAAFSSRRGALRLESSAFRRRRETYFDFRPFIAALRPAGAAALSAAVDELLLERRLPGIIILLSDFLVGAADYELALARLLAARYEVKVIHVLGARESEGSWPPGLYRIRDAETGELREAVLGPEAAGACRRRVEELAQRLKGFCDSRGIFYGRAFGAPNLKEIIAREFPRLGIIR